MTHEHILSVSKRVMFGLTASVAIYGHNIYSPKPASADLDIAETPAACKSLSGSNSLEIEKLIGPASPQSKQGKDSCNVLDNINLGTNLTQGPFEIPDPKPFINPQTSSLRDKPSTITPKADFSPRD